ncbi:MAG: BatA domain-containing protein, partial [Methylococcales bacterium]|nr:BatA domain-containing protein [Methylococcales bacterium]
MSFLGIGFLVGLAGIILPLAIHFFRKRRKVLQPWGAMRFLEEAKPNWKRRSLRLQDILILLLRCAAVAVLALAFARPVIKVPLPPTEFHELILIVDRSPSTEMGRDSGNALADEIVDQTAQLLTQTPPDTRIQIFVAGVDAGLKNGPPESGKPFNSPRNRDAWIANLKTQIPTSGDLDWPTAIRSALDFNDLPKPISRQIAVIADAAKYGWKANDTEIWAELADEISESPLFLIPVGQHHPARQFSNLCIDRLDTDSRHIQSGKKTILRAVISNRGSKASQPNKIQWSEVAEGRLIEASTIPKLAPNEIREVVLKRSFTKTGPQSVRLKVLTEDALIYDNTAIKTLTVIDKIPIAIFTDLPPDQITEPAVRFACWTLAAAAGHPDSIRFGNNAQPIESSDTTNPAPFFHLKWMTPDQLPDLDIDQYKIIIWSAANLPSPTDVPISEILRPFVIKGGGLWLRPPFETSPSEFNSIFFPHDYGISPASLAPIKQIVEEGGIGLRPPGSDTTDQFGKSAFSFLDELQAKRHFSLKNPSSSRVILAFEGGSPFVVQRSLGKGKVIVTAIDS